MDTERLGSTLYSWEAAEFASAPPVSRGWLWLMLIVWLGLLGWAIWARQWIAAALVVMVGVAAYVVRTSRPRSYTHRLTDLGVVIGQRLYPYDKLKSFWIVIEGEVRVLNILPDKKYGLLLTLQLSDANIDKVREILADRLPEDASRGEDKIDKIGRWLKL